MEMHEDAMLTTVDNPYDPFTEFDSWRAYDEQVGYFTCSLLARIALTSKELSDEENEKAIDEAMFDIIELFPGLYKRVTKAKEDSGGGS